MKTYIITYDLIKPESSPDYSRLIQQIKSFTFWAKPAQSVWLIKSDLSSSQILDMLVAVVDQNDKIVVIGVDNDWATYNISTEVTDWMKQGL